MKDKNLNRDRIPESQKDREWKRTRIKHYSDRMMVNYMDKDLLSLLEFCNGKLNDAAYESLVNPLKLKNPKFKNRATKVVNFDFVSSLFMRLQSEYGQRNSDPIVYTKNSNFDQEQVAKEKELIIQSLQQRFINNLIGSGQFNPNEVDPQTQQLVEPPLSPEVIKNQVSSMIDLRTMRGQRALDYIRQEQELDANFRQCFGYFIKLNRCITYKDVLNNKVRHFVVSPLKFSYLGNRNVRFLEKAEAVKAEYEFTYEEFLEIFDDLLDEHKEEYGDLRELYAAKAAGERSGAKSFFSLYKQNRLNGGIDNEDIKENFTIRVSHIQWTSYRKMYKILGEDGKLIEVDEDYPFDDTVEEFWRSEEREGWVVDGEYVFGGDPVPHQSYDPDNPYDSRKNYNGIIFMGNEDSSVPTLGEKLLERQQTYISLKFKLNEMIYKNKDKFTILPASLLGINSMLLNTKAENQEGNLANNQGEFSHLNKVENDDNPVARALHFIDALSILVIDDSSPYAATALQMLKSIDTSLGNSIMWLHSYAEDIRREAEELIGYNRQRSGNINSSDAVGNTQQAVYSGSLVVEEYFKSFEEFTTSEYQGLLDLSKFAFKLGERRTYIHTNTDTQILEVDEGFFESIYGVFGAVSARTKHILERLEGVASELIQNGMQGSTFAKLISGTKNFATIIQELETKEREAAEQRQNDLAHAAEMQQEQLAASEASKAADRELEKYKIDMETSVKMLELIGVVQAGTADNGDAAGAENLQKLSMDWQKHMADLSVKMKEQQNKLKMNKDNNDTKREISKDNVRIAVTNK